MSAGVEVGRGEDGAQAPIRVLVVDDHKIFAELLEFALSCEPGLVCVGRAENAAEAMRLFLQTRPSVVIMDLHLGHGDTEGIDITRAILTVDPQASVVVLTALKDRHLAGLAAAAGAAGFLQKNGSARTVIRALRAVHDGYIMVSPGILAELDRTLPPTEPALPALSPREAEVLALLGEGLRTRLIAERLDVSFHTVHTYTQSLMRKFDVHSQLEVLLKATRLGFLDGVPPSVRPDDLD